MAAYNKVVLTPALARCEPEAISRLRLNTAAETGLLVLVLAVVAALTLAPPLG